MRENYRLYKLYKMIQKNNGGEQPSVNVDAFLGLKPIKKLTLSNNQDKLVNHYIEKFSTCQSFEDIPYYKLTFNAKPEGDEDPTTLQFSYLYLQPYLISTPINLYAEYPVWVDYYNRNYTVAFIQLDEAMGFGFTENFLKEKNITKEELLQMDGWYDRQLQPYTGVLEYTNLVPVFASIENAASMVGMAEAPENAIKNCYTFDDFYLSVDVEYCDTVEEEEDLINYFVNRDFMNITTATNNDICEGTTAYIDGRLIEGGLREIENELVFDNTRRNAVNLDDNNLLWIESDTTNQDYVVRNGTSMKVAADASQTANAIGLTADQIIKGNTVLGVEGTGTTDATATAEEIASGYTAYVNGEKITGAVNMVTKGSTMGYIANSGELDGNNVGFKYVFTTTEGFRPDSNIKLYLNKSKVAALIGLTADKIKKGETILGITGTYEGDFTETVTPEEYTQAETQISDLFGEEV